MSIIEQAILVNSIAGLKHISNKYSRLYFGCEFCERLIPSIDILRHIFAVAVKRKLKFTLVTPFVTNAGLEALKPLFEYMLKNRYADTEIVINDWGVLRMLRKEFIFPNLILGRLLTKQKRDPRVLRFKKRVSLKSLQSFAEPSCDVRILSEFLAKARIGRVELDNIAQGVSRERSFLKASLYFPFVNVTIGRLCLTSSRRKEKKFSRVIWPCGKECMQTAFKLHNRLLGFDLFSRGNAQFFKNAVLQKNLDELNIDRLVYEPDVPL